MKVLHCILSVLFTFLYKFDFLAYQRCFYCVNMQKRSSEVMDMQEHSFYLKLANCEIRKVENQIL